MPGRPIRELDDGPLPDQMTHLRQAAAREVQPDN